jgi:phosphate transport system protein
MRDAYQSDLEAIFTDLASICRRVESAVASATEALLYADAAAADRVIGGDATIDLAREQLEVKAFDLILLQQPVAGDLRVIVAALRMVAELERMGDLSVHIAKVARLRAPERAIPDPLVDLFTAMATIAQDMTSRVRDIVLTRDVEAAIALGRDDEEMDRLRRRSFTEILERDWHHGVESAVDVALLGRYFERISDHAVSVANRVVFVVTGHNVDVA